jgi:hypothetical protein
LGGRETGETVGGLVGAELDERLVPTPPDVDEANIKVDTIGSVEEAGMPLP